VVSRMACLSILLVLDTGDTARLVAAERSTLPPANAKTVAGDYFRGDGTGYNVSLLLKENGKYTAECHGCLGNYGTASGDWKFTDNRIVLIPVNETGIMKGHLKTLDALNRKGSWVLMPTIEREFFEKRAEPYNFFFEKRVAKTSKHLAR
jgi:hypothetical protein